MKAALFISSASGTGDQMTSSLLVHVIWGINSYIIIALKINECDEDGGRVTSLGLGDGRAMLMDLLMIHSTHA